MSVHLYTPAQIKEPTQIENHVLVKGATSWDLSRFALITPVTRAQSKDLARYHCQCFEVAFDPGVATLSTAMRWKLLEISKDSSISVASGPTPLAYERAQEVVAFLRKHNRRPALRLFYRKGASNEVFILTTSR